MVHPNKSKNSIFLWGGHPARLGFWAARVAYLTEMYLQNWDAPGLSTQGV